MRTAGRRWAADRGATLPEYALGVALVAVVCLVGISFLQDASEDELVSRSDRVGSPDLEQGLTDGGSGGGSASGGTDGTPPPGPTAPATLTAGAPSQTAARTGNDWDATVTVAMLGDGSPVEGLSVQGTWTLYVEGVAQSPETVTPCVTGPSGQCVFTRDDMEWRTNRPEVTKAVFTVTSYLYTLTTPTVTYTIPPAPAQTIEVNRPS